METEGQMQNSLFGWPLRPSPQSGAELVRARRLVFLPVAGRPLKRIVVVTEVDPVQGESRTGDPA